MTSLANAKILRKQSTLIETKIWNCLRSRRFMGNFAGSAHWDHILLISSALKKNSSLKLMVGNTMNPSIKCMINVELNSWSNAGTMYYDFGIMRFYCNLMQWWIKYTYMSVVLFDKPSSALSGTFSQREKDPLARSCCWIVTDVFNQGFHCAYWPYNIQCPFFIINLGVIND